MSTIKILSETLSNKIAAGEVVERPAAVVKELVENALDADASRILVEIENGGRNLIRVSDNGRGLARDDALLAVERYATSKINDDSDLFNIRTLGFRGEALPSIAAVSRFSLTTRPADSDVGTGLYLEGGRLVKVVDEGAPIGTMVSVRQLFFNTPARRKFLKTITTEMAHIIDTLSTTALAWHGVHFRLLHNGKTIKNFLAADPAVRAVDVLGKELIKELHAIEYEKEEISINGWISSARTSRKTAQGIYLFVNGRPVRDRILQHGLMEGYERRLMKGQFPAAVLFIKIPFDRVDVNVHPTKNEVRFADPGRVHDALRFAAVSVLERIDRREWVAVPSRPPAENKLSKVAETPAVFKRQTIDAPITAVIESSLKDVAPGLPGGQAPLWESTSLQDCRVIGQFHGAYILCEAGDGLILVDQHAAHERIRFEELKRTAESTAKDSQRLLLPETIDLDYRQAAALSEMLPRLQNLGLDIEPFGGSTFVVKAVPAVLADQAIGPLVREVAEALAESGFSAGLQKAMEDVLIVMACHGTVRANQVLTPTEMQHLIRQLAQCQDPSHCPHGRPTWVRWDIPAIEKLFGRIV